MENVTGRGYLKKPEWRIGERNAGDDGNARNQGGNAGNRGGNQFSDPSLKNEIKTNMRKTLKNDIYK